MKARRPKNLAQSLRVALTLLQMTNDQGDRNRYSTDALALAAADILDSLVSAAGDDAPGAPELYVTGETADLLNRIYADEGGTTPTKIFFVDHRSRYSH
ncbi:hypothetical protein [Variovorax sp. 278MFTsu5.1]|uniref:hypothetical protein n=1 Tax=Variovorax sp. 278MFTsu5.1 TaxID=3158366 RepID=UPI003AAC1A15